MNLRVEESRVVELVRPSICGEVSKKPHVLITVLKIESGGDNGSRNKSTTIDVGKLEYLSAYLQLLFE